MTQDHAHKTVISAVVLRPHWKAKTPFRNINPVIFQLNVQYDNNVKPLEKNTENVKIKITIYIISNKVPLIEMNDAPSKR